MTDSTPRALCWRRILDDNGFEYATAQSLPAGVELAGSIVGLHNNIPLEGRYRIQCDSAWRTRAVSIEQHLGLQRCNLALAVDEAGAWTEETELTVRYEGIWERIGDA